MDRLAPQIRDTERKGPSEDKNSVRARRTVTPRSFVHLLQYLTLHQIPCSNASPFLVPFFCSLVANRQSNTDNKTDTRCALATPHRYIQHRSRAPATPCDFRSSLDLQRLPHVRIATPDNTTREKPGIGHAANPGFYPCRNRGGPHPGCEPGFRNPGIYQGRPISRAFLGF